MTVRGRDPRGLATIPKAKDGEWSKKKTIHALGAIKLANYPDGVPV